MGENPDGKGDFCICPAKSDDLPACAKSDVPHAAGRRPFPPRRFLFSKKNFPFFKKIFPFSKKTFSDSAAFSRCLTLSTAFARPCDVFPAFQFVAPAVMGGFGKNKKNSLFLGLRLHARKKAVYLHA